ncbi:MAG: ATP-binding protein [Parachlamydiales bacterium]
MRRLREPRRFIQVLIGPRQVGKTTLALQVAETLKRPCHYVTADLATLQDTAWIEQQWEVARRQIDAKRGGLLVIDEVQKVPHWSNMIKALWDRDSRDGVNLTVMILGSSPWLMQKGLAESLAGRFEIIPVTHWSYSEMAESFDWPLDHYLYFGGYPGSAPFADPQEVARWVAYINDSLVETTLSRDILLMTQVNKPALLRRIFQFACTYSGQILSYNKMVGQLQDAGNTTTVAHYLELLEGAGLVCGLEKFAMERVRRRGSSPKLMVLNTALLTAQSGKSYREAKEDRVFWGRLVESAVGAYLLNGIRGTPIELFYWREGQEEVDFVLRKGDTLVAIEVKSNHDTLAKSGMGTFVKRFSPNRILLVGDAGIPLERFLKTPVSDLLGTPS